VGVIRRSHGDGVGVESTRRLSGCGLERTWRLRGCGLESTWRLSGWGLDIMVEGHWKVRIIMGWV
jgi:hypothetical protein